MPTEAAGLYLHVPFCSAVCPYCDFAVLTGGEEKRRRFVEALLAEIALHRDSELTFDTIYLGGGTPTALATEQLARLLEALRENLAVDPAAHLSMEANPEDVDERRLAEWRELGVSTLSLGVQSFDSGALRLLGRRHSAEQARRCVESALEAGFETVSIDLMFALPGRDEAGWREELGRAIALGPHHVSCYQLTYHEGTPFSLRRDRGELVEPPETVQGELFRLTHRLLADAGYEAYEVSNFARGAGRRSAHNGKYWTHVPYLGLGPSAHSFAGRRRWWSHSRFETWRSAVTEGRLPIAGEELLGPEELALEALMLGLRTREGVALDRLRELTGLDLLPANRELVERLERQGLDRKSVV